MGRGARPVSSIRYAARSIARCTVVSVVALYLTRSLVVARGAVFPEGGGLPLLGSVRVGVKAKVRILCSAFFLFEVGIGMNSNTIGKEFAFIWMVAGLIVMVASANAVAKCPACRTSLINRWARVSNSCSKCGWH